MSAGEAMQRSSERGFLDELAGMPPAERVIMLARAVGEVIRASTLDHIDRREAVDSCLLIIEKSAGLRL